MTAETRDEILVVDDTPDNLKLLTALLSEQGYRVRPAASGSMALRSAAAKAPDLILLDVRMPDMDGYSVCQRLKADARLRPVPVIFISALNETADKLKGFAAGGVDYLAKPLEPAEVLARVRTHLELHRLQRRQEQIQIELERRVATRTAELATANQALQASEERLRLVIEATSDAIWDWNLRSNDLYFSERWYTMLGYAPGEFAAAYDSWRERVHPDDVAAAEAALQAHLDGRLPEYNVEFRLRTHSGSWHWIHARGRVVERDATGAPLRMVGTHVDIDTRKRAEDALRYSEARHRHLVESSPICIHEIDMNGRLQSMNPAGLNMLGLTDEQKVCGLDYLNTVNPRDRARIQGLLKSAFDGVASHFEFTSSDAPPLYFKSCFIPIVESDGRVEKLMGLTENITERKLAEARIAAALREKEVLLKEIYHRVKNNLQVVSSLLSMQSAKAGCEACALLAESAGRVRAMALVHELLYRSPDLSVVELRDYFAGLLRSLAAAHDGSLRNVRVEPEVDSVRVGIETAIPLGLVVNELVSNAYKHAFPGERGGRILLRLKALADGQLELEVADDGVGLPAGFQPEATESLGMQLVVSLTRQLAGRLDYSSTAGTHFVLRFVPEEDDKRRFTVED